MSELDYKKMFRDVKATLDTLHGAKANLEDQLSKVEAKIEANIQIYNAVAPLVDEPLIPSFSDVFLPPTSGAIMAGGISLAIRSVLEDHMSESFTAAQMRDLLEKEGWDWTAYGSPLATVHKTLMRLAHAGFATEEKTKDGTKCFYSAKRPPASAMGLSEMLLAAPPAGMAKPRGVLGEMLVKRAREKQK